MNKPNQTITAVVLTYGERKFIHTVLEYLCHQKMIEDIVVVCNSGKFQHLPSGTKKFHIVSNERNLGSAAGYKIGLEIASGLANHFVWLLDDDNLPEDGTIENLVMCWEKYNCSDIPFAAALQCYRTSQFSYKKIYEKNVLNLLPLHNSFLGFHIKRIVKIIINRLNPPLFSSFMMNQELYSSNAAFYGGLFMETDTLTKISMPNEKYFIYVDDLDFTHDLIRKGGKIFVSTKSVINDLDYSINLKEKRKFLYHPLLGFSTNMKAFFYSRNVFFYTKSYLRTSKFLYFVNKYFFFLLFGFLVLVQKRFYRYKVVLAGIKAGERWYKEENS